MIVTPLRERGRGRERERERERERKRDGHVEVRLNEFKTRVSLDLRPAQRGTRGRELRAADARFVSVRSRVAHVSD